MISCLICVNRSLKFISLNEVISIGANDSNAGERGEVLHVLRKHLDIQAQRGSGDLAIGPVNTVRKTKSTIQLKRGKPILFVGNNEIERLQERIDQIQFIVITRACKQFGGDKKMCSSSGAASNSSKERNRLGAAA